MEAAIQLSDFALGETLGFFTGMAVTMLLVFIGIRMTDWVEQK